MSDTPENSRSEAASFLQRWSQRKRQQQQQTELVPEAHALPAVDPAVKTPVTGQELPDIEMLDENSEISMFMNEAVSEKLQRQVLRKIFHMEKFNVCDGLDDYAEDYSCFEPLGDVVTAFQRLQTEREELARKAGGEEASSAGLDDTQQSTTEPHVDSDETSTGVTLTVDENDADGGKKHEG